MSIGYQVVENVLTNPSSYTCRVVPNSVLGYDEIASYINTRNPNLPVATIKTVLDAFAESTQQQLADGNTVNLSNFCSFTLTMPVKLTNPTDQLPADPLNVVAKISAPFKEEVRHVATYTRLDTIVKAPVITAVKDLTYRLQDILGSGRGMGLSGSNLKFDLSDYTQGVSLTGYSGAEEMQYIYANNTGTSVIAIPTVTLHTESGRYFNEYRVKHKVRYTEGGSLRVSEYTRPVRFTLHPDASHRELFYSVGKAACAKIKTITCNNLTEAIVFAARVNVQTDALEMRTESNVDGMEAPTYGAWVAIPSTGDYALPSFLPGEVDDVAVTVTSTDILRQVAAVYNGNVVEACYLGTIAAP